MKRLTAIVAISLAVVVFSIPTVYSMHPSLQKEATQAASRAFTPPPTQSIPIQDTLHGMQLTDPYRWLENKKDPTVVEWTKKQHEYTVEYVKQNSKVVPGLQDEIEALFDRTVTSPPSFKADREFFYRRTKGDAQRKAYTRYQGKEILLFDPVALDPSGKTSISFFTLNKDASKVAVGYQKGGSELTDIRIIDTKTGQQIGNDLKGFWGFSWAKDERYAFITPRTKELVEQQKPLATYLHKLGDDHKNDVKLIEPSDARINAYVYEPEEAELTVFGYGDYNGGTVKIRPVGSKEEPRVIYSSEKFYAYPAFKGEKIYWFTNENAPNKKILLSTLAKPDYKDARVLIPEGETVIEDFEITKDWLLVLDKKDVLSRIKVYKLDGSFVRELPLPEVADVSSMSYHKESNTLYVSLSSFTAPAKLYKVDGTKLTWEFFYQDKPPVDLSDVEAKILFCTGKDGARIPMFVVHKKGLVLDGNNPTLMMGYGGFNNGIKPYFVGYAASFIKRGGVWVNVGLRGGDEFGEKWHTDAMVHKKQNTFDDCIAVAEYLIAQKYTNPQKLLIQGGSNGGLLVGAVITQRPDLFKAAICQVPLLDMVRYTKFQIARYWIPEYGDPEKADEFHTLLRYSPYHNIRMGVNLPTTLVTVGENDVRVDPLHGKKFVAALQNNIGQVNPILLWVDYDAGHQGGKTMQQGIQDNVFMWTFIMNQLTML